MKKVTKKINRLIIQLLSSGVILSSEPVFAAEQTDDTQDSERIAQLFHAAMRNDEEGLKGIATQQYQELSDRGAFDTPTERTTNLLITNQIPYFEPENSLKSPADIHLEAISDPSAAQWIPQIPMEIWVDIFNRAGIKSVEMRSISKYFRKIINSKIKILKISKQINDFSYFPDFLNSLDNLLTLDLRNSKIGDLEAQGIARALLNTTPITELLLGCNQIGDDGVKTVATALANNTTLTTLDLHANQIGTAGAQSLSELLESNNTLTMVNLFNNPIENPGVFTKTKMFNLFGSEINEVKVRYKFPHPNILYEHQELLFSGSFIKISDVQNFIRQTAYPISILKVFGFHTSLIDADLFLSGTSVALIVPCLKVIGQRTINLCGANGIKGADGALGLPHGAHGQHGGHLYAKAGTYDNINGLSVKTKGGNGRLGGKGGNGINGTAGTNASSTVSSQSQYGNCRARRGEQGGHAYYNHNNASLGTAGGNAGGGGRGGLAGQNGTALIEGQWNNAAQHAVATNGGDGNPGIPGIGGVHGRNHQGHYHWWLVRNGESTWQGQNGNWRTPFNKWVKPKGYVNQNPPQAASGIVIPTNAVQQRQAPQMPLTIDFLRHEYTENYNREVPGNPFLRPFGN